MIILSINNLAFYTFVNFKCLSVFHQFRFIFIDWWTPRHPRPLHLPHGLGFHYYGFQVVARSVCCFLRACFLPCTVCVCVCVYLTFSVCFIYNQQKPQLSWKIVIWLAGFNSRERDYSLMRARVEGFKPNRFAHPSNNSLRLLITVKLQELDVCRLERFMCSTCSCEVYAFWVKIRWRELAG